VDGSQVTCGTCDGLPPQSEPDVGGRGNRDFHVSLQKSGCNACHVGYTGAAVDPALHVNAIRDVLLQYLAPDPANPDPVGACNAPVTRTARVSGWDCAGYHSLKDAWVNACCGIVDYYLRASHAPWSPVGPEDLAVGRIDPTLKRIREACPWRRSPYGTAWRARQGRPSPDRGW
jgi:hypothetical protein